MRIFGLAGWSGSGKTTLLTAVIPDLTARGLTVSTIKHAHHEFDIDRPGKDSWRHREAGAHEVMVASARRWAIMHELRGAAEPTLDELVARMNPVDLLLVEGWKHHPHPKIEVHRPSLGKPLLYPSDPHILAIATDEAFAAPLPLLLLGDPGAVASFIADHLGFASDHREAGHLESGPWRS
jgi:molybdopterin-guanine dinucleotide biosynthesis adapter protein